MSSEPLSSPSEDDDLLNGFLGAVEETAGKVVDTSEQDALFLEAYKEKRSGIAPMDEKGVAFWFITLILHCFTLGVSQARIIANLAKCGLVDRAGGSTRMGEKNAESFVRKAREHYKEYLFNAMFTGLALAERDLKRAMRRFWGLNNPKAPKLKLSAGKASCELHAVKVNGDLWPLCSVIKNTESARSAWVECMKLRRHAAKNELTKAQKGDIVHYIKEIIAADALLDSQRKTLLAEFNEFFGVRSNLSTEMSGVSEVDFDYGDDD